MKIVGMIDGSPTARSLAGWARDAAGRHPLIVEARLDGVAIARTATDIARADLDGQVGFLLELDRPIDLAQLSSGRLTVIAGSTADTGLTALAWHPPLLDLLDKRDRERKLAALPYAQLIEGYAEAARIRLADAAGSADRADYARLDRLIGWARNAAAAPRPAEPLTYVATVPGSVSPDGAALIGHNGHVYLRGGSNDLIAQFRRDADDPAIGEAVAGWSALFRRRAARLADRGIAYVQTIIPEKLSIVPDYWPEPIATPSPILAGIEAAMIDMPFYCSAYRALSGSADRARSYRKIDTHFSWRGTRTVYDALCRAIAGRSPFGQAYRFDYPVLGGDLDRFPGLSLVERLELPDSEELALAGRGIRQTSCSVPDPGQHVGTRLGWTNPAAPIDRKVLVFGNSFFESRLGPTTLSWWFARTFRDYRFVWSSDFDDATIDAIRPDIVVGQTIERFLPRVADE